jgi:hypothetical protein
MYALSDPPKTSSKPLKPFVFGGHDGSCSRVCSNHRVLCCAETCNRSPMIPHAIPNYGLSSSNLFLLFVQRSLRRPCPSPKKGHQGTTSRKRYKDCTPSNEIITMFSLVKTFPPPSLTCLVPLGSPLKHFLNTFDTLCFHFFMVIMAFARRFCSNHRVLWGPETCNRSPMISPTIPNYNNLFFSYNNPFFSSTLCVEAL